MFNPTLTLINSAIHRLQVGDRHSSNLNPTYADLIEQIATTTLHAIAHTDALYHNVEHTILVTLVGQEILRGQQLLEGAVSPDDWLHFLIALLCHDIGYLKGICQQDCVETQTYATGTGDRITLAPGATDASLTAYHVDRGKQFVAENLAHYQAVDVAAVQTLIELTRFPVPPSDLHQDTRSYPGLARAADLIGQLSDPRYLEKLPALFYEFDETGANVALGYQHPGDLRRGYPKFFQTVVQPLIQPAVRYLQATQAGQQILNHLHRNVWLVERELAALDSDRAAHLIEDRYHFFLQKSDDDVGITPSATSLEYASTRFTTVATYHF